MHRIWAIIERDLRRFRRSPVLVVVSIIMPLVQLVVLGYAFGGKIKNLQVGVVDEDHGVPAIKLNEMFQAVAANARTFDTDFLQRPGRGPAGFAQWQNQRRAEHPAGILPQGPRRRQSAHRAGGGQYGPILVLGARRRLEWVLPAYNSPPVAAAHDAPTPRCPSSRFIPTCRTSSFCCRAPSCWPFSFRP